MSGVDAALRDFAALDSLARRQTWVHRVDPRAKVLVTALYVVLIASLSPRAVAELLPFFCYPLVLFIAGRLPLRILVRPLTLALLLGGLIGIANPLLDREPMMLAAGIQIAGGWLSFASILLRSVLCVAAAIALIATTGIERLCQAMLRLGVPRVVVVQVMLLYRYIFVLGSSAQSMSRASQLRSCGRPLRLAAWGPLVGHLLLRSLDRAERAYQAMCCRGFRGQVPVGATLRFRVRDAAFLAAWCGVLILLRWHQPIEFLGSQILGVAG